MSSQGKSLFLSVALHFDAPNRAVNYIHVSGAVFLKKEISKQLTSITEHLSDQVTNKGKKNSVLFLLPVRPLFLLEQI